MNRGHELNVAAKHDVVTDANLGDVQGNQPIVGEAVIAPVNVLAKVDLDRLELQRLLSRAGAYLVLEYGEGGQ